MRFIIVQNPGRRASWETKHPIKEEWTIGYKELRFKISPTGFKHTGLFPEQAANWDFVMNKIRNSKRDDIRVLNLFAYTGGATIACSKAGRKRSCPGVECC